ncbi:MAG: hypothetical protein JNJ59_03420 [Deltaproteobacteria bacterium]|nr:hypothetical protein [Deltaproteobacteria bacterium]
MTFLAPALLATLTFATACASAPSVPPPLDAAPPTAPDATLVWVGRGEAERKDGGRWVRDPAFDYDFSVEQRRFADRWESVKTMRRLHPDYDGSAGPREQVLWFHLRWPAAAAAGDLHGQVASRLGAGTIVSDREFRRAEIDIRPDISAHAPFDTYRIRQRYLYEEGRLEETVELLDHDGRDGAQEIDWVRNTERATLFSATRLPGPPTPR